MHSLFLALSATTDPTPAGTLRPGLTEDQISPGIWGFLATAFVVVLTIFVIVDMVRRLRRVRYRTQVEEERELREAEERGTAERDHDDDGGEAGAVVDENESGDHRDGHAANGAGNGSSRS